MQRIRSNLIRSVASELACASGGLAAIVVGVRATGAAPFVLAAALLLFAFVQWRKRATYGNVLVRLFFLFFTVVLAAIVVIPAVYLWLYLRMGAA